FTTLPLPLFFLFFFFQAEDGIRDRNVTGVQTCALPISTAKVPLDYLITDGKNKYSVPFDLIGEEVDIRLTKTMVEVFFHGSRVASHKRVLRPLRDPIVQPEHMPIEHRKYLTYNADEFIRWGQKRRA